MHKVTTTYKAYPRQLCHQCTVTMTTLKLATNTLTLNKIAIPTLQQITQMTGILLKAPYIQLFFLKLSVISYLEKYLLRKITNCVQYPILQ